MKRMDIAIAVILTLVISEVLRTMRDAYTDRYNAGVMEYNRRIEAGE